jgi:site-specific recombinase XerC
MGRVCRIGARYTAGTEFYLATGDIYATQQLLGHADVSTTANILVQGVAG